MNILEVRGVYKSYENNRVLNNIFLSVPQQAIYGLLGPNGAGKTTLIRIINKIIMCDEGEVLFKGQPMTRNDLHKLGYLPEERGLYNKMKVGEHLLYLAQLKGMKSHVARQVVKKHLKEFECIDWYNKKIEQLSKGMQQKIQFIIAIMHAPEFIILDEPFSGFDPVNTEMIKNKILDLKKNGVTFMLSTHRMESVEELCNYVTLINKSKKMIDGEKNKIKEQFSKNIYEVKGYCTRTLPETVNGLYSLIENEVEEDTDLKRLVFKLDHGKKTNELLQFLVNEMEVVSMREIVPDMNDIFISLVNNVDNE